MRGEARVFVIASRAQTHTRNDIGSQQACKMDAHKQLRASLARRHRDAHKQLRASLARRHMDAHKQLRASLARCHARADLAALTSHARHANVTYTHMYAHMHAPRV